MRVPVMVGGIKRWKHVPAPSESSMGNHAPTKLLLREAYGAVLRETRQHKKQSLRSTSVNARMALGYLSEVERGKKEPSSEVIASLCEALEIPMSEFLLLTSIKMQGPDEVVAFPDTIPEDLVRDVYAPLAEG